jgi:hypothetical protein
MGTFLFSDETAKRLEKLMQELDNPHYNNDLHEEISSDLEAVDAALVDLKRTGSI